MAIELELECPLINYKTLLLYSCSGLSAVPLENQLDARYQSKADIERRTVKVSLRPKAEAGPDALLFLTFSLPFFGPAKGRTALAYGARSQGRCQPICLREAPSQP